MTIEVAKDGTVKWIFYRKSYRKARWRKLGQRLLDDFRKTPDAYGLIFVVWNRQDGCELIDTDKLIKVIKALEAL